MLETSLQHAAARLKLFQLTDSAFPSGAFSHSFGLEGLVEEGVVASIETLREYLFEQLAPSLLKVDLPYVRFSFDAATEHDWAGLALLDQELDALKISRELREASVQMGSQRLAMLLTLYPSPLLEKLSALQSSGEIQGHSAWVHGATGAFLGFSVHDLSGSFYYSALASAIAASMKLIRIGQVAAQTILSEVLSAAPQLISESMSLERIHAGCFLPLCDIASARHETAYSRLFIS